MSERKWELLVECSKWTGDMYADVPEELGHSRQMSKKRKTNIHSVFN
jgi:hypothetical protein